MAEAFATALEAMPRWQQHMQAGRSNWDDYLRNEFFAFVDYLAMYVEDGSATYRQLLIGEKVKALYDPESDDAARLLQIESINASELHALESVLKARLSADAWALLANEMHGIHGVLSSRAIKAQRVLFIGDCIFLDIVPFIVGELLEAGIRLVPDYAASKNPLELRDHLRKLGAAQKFDLVFCSPFSYEFAADYARLASAAEALTSSAQAAVVAEQAWAAARPTIDLAADLFDCPVIVHNSAAIVREESGFKRTLKAALTARARSAGRARVNELLDAHVVAVNAASFKHLFVFDELRFVNEHGEWLAGGYFYRTALQHPAVMGSVLAPHYVDLVFATAWLAKKKLIVSDLDNTLWDGVIGEGDVAHHHDRQQALRELKDKGVVLAIASKNDPANVHWRGGTLNDADFVHAEISWGTKVQAMKRIQAELNLKMKDFVFIDDRADELELMRTTYPDVVCLDATDAATWRRLAIWKNLLDDEVEMDRTLMYQQREQRKEFVVDEASDAAEKARLFAALDLKVTITRAKTSDLKRVTELINRTNQFNLQGSRTNFREVTAWHGSKQHIILTAQTADRFGDMGTTCIAVAEITGEEIFVPIFVLSCRVFGYGVERSVLNHLKTMAQLLGIRRMAAHYIKTAQNQPCADFLESNGFHEDGERWLFEIGASSPVNAQWLKVEALTT